MTMELPAGRELDILVAEKVMGYEHFVDEADGTDRLRGNGIIMPIHLPAYSTDIAAAWEVVEKLRAEWMIRVGTADLLGTPWKCVMWQRYMTTGGPFGEADTAPLAICRAALGVVGA